MITLIAVPVIFMSIITVIVLNIPSLPEFEAWLLMIGSLGASLLSIIYLFKRVLRIPCEVKISEAGVEIRILRRSVFYPKQSRLIFWSNLSCIQNELFSEIEFVELIAKKPSTRFVLEAEPGQRTQLFSFFNALKVNASLYQRNATQFESKKTVSFFSTRIAKLIAGIISAAMVCALLWLIMDGAQWNVYAWLRVMYLYLLGLPFLYKVVRNAK